jgi:hypothetical protein
MKIESKIKTYRNKIVVYHKHQNEVLRFDTGLKISKKESLKKIYTENFPLFDTIKNKVDGYIKDSIINNAFNRVVYVKNQLNKEQLQSSNNSKNDPNAVYCWYWFNLYYTTVLTNKVQQNQIEASTAKPYLTIVNDWKNNEVLNKIKIHSFNYEHIEYLFNVVDANKTKSVRNKRLIHLGVFSDWLNDEIGLVNDIRKHITKFKKVNKKVVKVITATPISFTHIELRKFKEQKDIFLEKIEHVKEQKNTKTIKQLNTYVKVLDITLVSCSTGLNWCDLKNTTRTSINNNLITGKRIKTGVSYQIPFANITADIFEKYNYAVTKGITPNTYNRILKELIGLIGIDRKVNRVNTINGNNEVVLLSEIACHKLCRKTFITLIIEANKISLNHAISMFGHSSYDILKHYANRNVLSSSVNDLNQMFTELV